MVFWSNIFTLKAWRNNYVTLDTKGKTVILTWPFATFQKSNGRLRCIHQTDVTDRKRRVQMPIGFVREKKLSNIIPVVLRRSYINFLSSELRTITTLYCNRLLWFTHIRRKKNRTLITRLNALGVVLNGHTCLRTINTTAIIPIGLCMSIEFYCFTEYRREKNACKIMHSISFLFTHCI